MGQITTSLVINFEAVDPDAILTAEIDDRDDGFNDGNTSFVPGDSPAFLVFKSDNVTIDTMESTSGSVTTLQTGKIQVSEIITMIKSKEATLEKPPIGAVNLTLLSGYAEGLVVSGNKLVTSDTALAVIKAEYASQYQAYRLTNVPTSLGGETSFPVVVYIEGIST